MEANGGNQDAQSIEIISGVVVQVDMNDGKNEQPMKDFVAVHIKKPSWEHAVVARAFSAEMVLQLRLNGAEALLNLETGIKVRKRPTDSGKGFYRDILSFEPAYAGETDDAQASVARTEGNHNPGSLPQPPSGAATFTPMTDKDAYLACPIQVGEAYSQWHMDRRTALMQSKAEGLEQIVQAELLFEWLRGWIEVPEADVDGAKQPGGGSDNADGISV